MPLSYKPYKPVPSKPFKNISKDLKKPPKEPSGKGLIFGAIFCTCITLAFDGYIAWGAIRQIQAIGIRDGAGLDDREPR